MKNNEEKVPKEHNKSKPVYDSRSHYASSVYYGAGTYGASQPDDQIDIMRLILIGLRRWKTILLIALLVVGLGFLYLHFATPIYRANTLMEMSVRRPRLIKESAAVIEDASSRIDQDVIFNTRLAKFQSRSMRERVAKTYLEQNPAVTNSVEDLTKELGEVTSWSSQRKTFIVEVNVESADPVFAQTIANLYADCATRVMIEENQLSSDNAVSWLLKQAEQQRLDLAKAEESIVNYRTEASLDSLRNQKTVGEETLIKLNETSVDLEGRLITERSLSAYINKIKANPNAVQTVPEGIANAEQLSEFLQGWWDARIELAELQERYKALHPSVKNAEAKVALMQRRLDGYLSTTATTISNGVNLLENQVRDIRSRIAQESQSVLNLELKMVQAEGFLNTLTRERDAADVTYRSVLSRIEESRMAADENTAVLKLLQSAELPEFPVSPRKLQIIALALVLGVGLGYGVGFLIELLEDKLTGARDLERLDLNLLTIIPRQKVELRKDLATLSLQDKFSHFSETMASLRTMLTYEEARERYRVILTTSTQPSEGKTIVSCNLAIAMAQAGRKTLLIDLDLRRPRLRKIFAVQNENAPSLLHTLNQPGVENFADLPVNGGHENLDVIVSKSSDEISPAEIIGGGNIEKLIAWARENYDCVIIDTPPLGVVVDAQKIADFVDGVILIARPEHTRKRSLRHAAERIESINTNVIGVVLNNVAVNRFMTYSSHYHHYNSYYTYDSYKTKKVEEA